MRGVYDVGPSPTPRNFRGAQWNAMEFQHFAIFPVQSNHSAGDSVEFYAFGYPNHCGLT